MYVCVYTLSTYVLIPVLCLCVYLLFCVFLAAASQPSRPEIVEPPTDVYEVIGSEVNLTCVATGVPQPTIRWYKDDVLLPNQITPLLVIQDLRLDTRGLYTCEAANEHGNCSETAYIKIKGTLVHNWQMR